MADDKRSFKEQLILAIKNLNESLKVAEDAGDYEKAEKIRNSRDELLRKLEKSMPAKEYVDAMKIINKSEINPKTVSDIYKKQSVKPINMADQIPYQKGTKTAEAINQMQKIGKLKRVASAVGKRVAKAAPYVGTGLGLMAAKEALKKGDKVGAALETASAIDPTPISDIILAGKDIYDIAREPSSEEDEIEVPIIADPEAIENVKEMLGNKQEMAPEEQYSTYENYMKKQRKKLGYE